MHFTRRTFMHFGAASVAAATVCRVASSPLLGAMQRAAFPVGVTDWNLRKTADPTSFALARQLGFEGVQVSLAKGSPRLPIDDEIIRQYRAESESTGVAIASTCLNILHTNYLKTDPLGPQRVSEGIALTRSIGVEVMLLPFFDAGALQTPAEMDRVGDILRELGPDAEKAGVILGLENTISARDNMRIIERAQSPAVWVYYDVGNSTVFKHSVVEEVRWLGRERICEIHLKDNPHYMGEGSIDFQAVVDALADIGFTRWAVLETSTVSDLEADMRRNLRFLRDRMAQRGG